MCTLCTTISHKKTTSRSVVYVQMSLFWPRPIFATRCQVTIVSAGAFDDSVRNGKRSFHTALETKTKPSVLFNVRYSLTSEEYMKLHQYQFFRHIKIFNRYLSTARLKSLRIVHRLPINLLISQGSYWDF